MLTRIPAGCWHARARRLDTPSFAAGFTMPRLHFQHFSRPPRRSPRTPRTPPACRHSDIAPSSRQACCQHFAAAADAFCLPAFADYYACFLTAVARPAPGGSRDAAAPPTTCLHKRAAHAERCRRLSRAALPRRRRRRRQFLCATPAGAMF